MKKTLLSKELREVSPQEWVLRIAKLPSKLHPVVSCIVWWDWFSERLVPDRWPHMDQYLPFREHDDIPAIEIIEALVQIGYPQRKAELRMKAW